MTGTAPSMQGRRLGVAIAALSVAGLILGACSSSGSSGSSESSSSSSSSSGSSGSSGSSFLQQLQQRAQAGTHATFKATYSATNTSSGTSSTQTLTFAQKGSKSSFSTGTTTFYTDGSTSTTCDNSSGTPTCFTSSGGANPLAGLLTLISPTGVASAIQAAAAAAAGVSVSHTSETHGGQSSECVSYSKAGQGVKYCVNGDGVVTYIATPSGTFELVSYTTSVSDSDVTVPANATTQSIPSVP